jgi:hypothetical protein
VSDSREYNLFYPLHNNQYNPGMPRKGKTRQHIDKSSIYACKQASKETRCTNRF